MTALTAGSAKTYAAPCLPPQHLAREADGRQLVLAQARQPEQPQHQQQQQQGAAALPERCPQCGEGFATLQELVFHVDAFPPAGTEAATAGMTSLPARALACDGFHTAHAVCLTCMSV